MAAATPTDLADDRGRAAAPGLPLAARVGRPRAGDRTALGGARGPLFAAAAPTCLRRLVP